MSWTSACASRSFTASDVPACGVHWLTEPVTTKSAPSTNAAARLSGAPRPPAAPTRMPSG
ncbi:hypothetical protein ACFQ3Z_42860 [Streptomyces nogalater]